MMPDNEEFIRSLEDATISIVLDIEKRVEKACLLVENQAKMDCPVDEGVLRASITSETEVTETEIVGRIGSNEEYAPYVHNGTGIYAKDGNGRKTPWIYQIKSSRRRGYYHTVGQRAQPFLLYAQLFNRDRIEKILGG